MASVIVADPVELAGASAATGADAATVGLIAGRAVRSAIDAEMAVAALLAPRRAAVVGSRLGALLVGGGDSLGGIGVAMGTDAAELLLAAGAIARAEGREILGTPVDTVQLSSRAEDNVVVRRQIMKGKIEGKFVVVAAEIQGEVRLEELADGKVRVTLAGRAGAGVDLETVKAFGGVDGSAGWVVANRNDAERLLAQLAWQAARSSGRPELAVPAEGLRLLVGNPARIPSPQRGSTGVYGRGEVKGDEGKLKAEIRALRTTDSSVQGGRTETEFTVTGRAEGEDDRRERDKPSRLRTPGRRGVAGADAELSVTVGQTGDNPRDVAVRIRDGASGGADASPGSAQRGNAVVDGTIGQRAGTQRERTFRVPQSAAGDAARQVVDAARSGDPGRLRDIVAGLERAARDQGLAQQNIYVTSETSASAEVDARRAGVAVEGSYAEERLVDTRTAR